jgi:hypothetical protein
MAIKDYSVTMQDSQGRTCELYINGDSVQEAINGGCSQSIAEEQHETDAFWSAVKANLIAEDAILVSCSK